MERYINVWVIIIIIIQSFCGKKIIKYLLIVPVITKKKCSIVLTFNNAEKTSELNKPSNFVSIVIVECQLSNIIIKQNVTL